MNGTESLVKGCSNRPLGASVCRRRVYSEESWWNTCLGLSPPQGQYSNRHQRWSCRCRILTPSNQQRRRIRGIHQRAKTDRAPRLGSRQGRCLHRHSLILHNQLKDVWKVGRELLPWYKKAKALMNGFQFIEMRKIPRSQNRVAHRAAKAAYYEARLGQLKKE